MARIDESAGAVDGLEGDTETGNSTAWDNVEGYEERRKIQNRIAQRNYRQSQPI